MCSDKPVDRNCIAGGRTFLRCLVKSGAAGFDKDTGRQICGLQFARWLGLAAEIVGEKLAVGKAAILCGKGAYIL